MAEYRKRTAPTITTSRRKGPKIAPDSLVALGKSSGPKTCTTSELRQLRAEQQARTVGVQMRDTLTKILTEGDRARILQLEQELMASKQREQQLTARIEELAEMIRKLRKQLSANRHQQRVMRKKKT
jgi:hypothetical protein